MSNQNTTPPSDYNSANQWAQNQTKNSNGIDDGSNISMFWIMTIILLCLLAGWWWWCNYRPKDPVINNGSSSPMEDLKNGAHNTNSKLQISPDGNIV